MIVARFAGTTARACCFLFSLRHRVRRSDRLHHVAFPLSSHLGSYSFPHLVPFLPPFSALPHALPSPTHPTLPPYPTLHLPTTLHCTHTPFLPFPHTSPTTWPSSYHYYTFLPLPLPAHFYHRLSPLFPLTVPFVCLAVTVHTLLPCTHTFPSSHTDRTHPHHIPSVRRIHWSLVERVRIRPTTIWHRANDQRAVA